jgi:hypothetical protein
MFENTRHETIWGEMKEGEKRESKEQTKDVY